MLRSTYFLSGMLAGLMIAMVSPFSSGRGLQNSIENPNAGINSDIISIIGKGGKLRKFKVTDEIKLDEGEEDIGVPVGDLELPDFDDEEDIETEKDSLEMA